MERGDEALRRGGVERDGAPKKSWRVATIAHDGRALWVVQPEEFGDKRLAEEWAHQVLWLEREGQARPRNTALLEVVDGVLQVPGWMRVQEQEAAG